MNGGLVISLMVLAGVFISAKRWGGWQPGPWWREEV